MFKIVREPNSIRIVDEERNLQLVRGAGAYGTHYEYFSRIGDTEHPLTCEFRWQQRSRYLTDVERKALPPEIEWMVFPYVMGATGDGHLQIPGYSRKETLEIIAEALMCGVSLVGPENFRDFGPYKLKKNMAYTVEFSSILQNWAQK